MSKVELQTTKRTAYAEQILRAYSGSVEAIIQTGRLLCEAKEGLKHGEFTAMLQDDMPFSARTAQMLMAITNDPRLSNPKHASLLPPSWYTLYKLSELHDDEFEKGIEDGTIRPDMNRAEIKRLHAIPGHLATPKGIVTVEPEADEGEHPGESEDPLFYAIRGLREASAALEAPRREILDALARMASCVNTLMDNGLDDPKRRKFLETLERSREYINTASLGSLQIDTTRFCDETWEQVR